MTEKVDRQKASSVEDATLNFFYKPHSISILVIFLCTLVYWAFYTNDSDNILNTKLGITVGFFVFLIIGMLQFRDGPFIRPHMAFWRVVLSCSVAYEVLLIFMLFQNKKYLRQLLKVYIDPKLGVPLPERSYAENCNDYSLENIWNNIDIFVLAHSLGWYAKAIILRDYWFCWILSVIFELMEYTLQHQLPNFQECWWDHWILDVLVTNWLGTYLGMKTCEYFEVKHYSWRGIGSIRSYRGKMKRTFQQLLPHSWTKFKWGSTKTFKNFLAVVGLLYLVLQVELNAFYLKYLLWVPAEHSMNVWRLILFFFISMPAVREAYQFMTDRRCKRFGMHAWIAVANIITELLIIIKFGKGEFPKPMPDFIYYSWIVAITALIGWAFYQFYLCPKYFKHSVPETESGFSSGGSDEMSEEEVEEVKHRKSSRLIRKKLK